MSITAGAAHRWEWTPLGRGASAVGVGITGAVTSGSVVPLLLAQGATTAEVVAQGAAPSILCVMEGSRLRDPGGARVTPQPRGSACPHPDAAKTR